MATSAPVGILDSGVGGLSILSDIHKELPEESLVYFGDRANCPYGSRTFSEIDRLARRMIDFLLQRHHCKIIVIACNTITGSLINSYRRDYPIPFVGVEPATRVASRNTRTGHIGILATPATFRGYLFNRTRSRFAGRKVTVHVQSAPELVTAVESGRLTDPSTRRIVKKHITPLLNQGIDQLVLGCTHFPFLGPVIESLIPAGVSLVDPSSAVAAQVRRILRHHQLESRGGQAPGHYFYSSGLPLPLKNLVPELDLSSSRIYDHTVI